MSLYEAPPLNHREFLERETKKLWEEAYAADPHWTSEITVIATGAEAFAWSRLTAAELQALRRLLYTIVLEARG